MYDYTPTQNQIMGLVRQLLPIVGSMAVTFGWLTTDQVGRMTTMVLQASGPLLILGGLAWAIVANSKKSILTKAANMPEVKQIKIAPKDTSTASIKEANELVAATPAEVVKAT